MMRCGGNGDYDLYWCTTLDCIDHSKRTAKLGSSKHTDFWLWQWLYSGWLVSSLDVSPLLMKITTTKWGEGAVSWFLYDLESCWRGFEIFVLGQSETNFDLHLLTQMPGGIVDEETTCATAAWGGLTDSLLVQLNYSTHTRSSFTYSSFSSSRDRNNETRKFLSTTPLHFFYTLSVHGQNIQHSSTALQKCFSSLPLTGLPILNKQEW